MNSIRKRTQWSVTTLYLIQSPVHLLEAEIFRFPEMNYCKAAEVKL